MQVDIEREDHQGAWSAETKFDKQDRFIAYRACRLARQVTITRPTIWQDKSGLRGNGAVPDIVTNRSRGLGASTAKSSHADIANWIQAAECRR